MLAIHFNTASKLLSPRIWNGDPMELWLRELEDVSYILASGEELSKTLEYFEDSIPVPSKWGSKPHHTQQMEVGWYGDIARTILLNLWLLRSRPIDSDGERLPLDP